MKGLMKLLEFQIQNYKTIQNSGWIKCDEVTAFVGKNEAGKTSLLRALSKLKSTDRAEYDPIKEFPHGRYTDEFKKMDWPVVSAKFELNDEERGELVEIQEAHSEVKTATVTKYYSGEYTVGFDPAPQAPNFTLKDWTSVLKETVKAVERVVPKFPEALTQPHRDQVKATWASQQQQITNHFNALLKTADDDKELPELFEVQNARKYILDRTPDEWCRTAVNQYITRLEEIIEKLEVNSKLGEGRTWIVQHMPSFLFFSNYEMLQSAIFLPEFVQRCQAGGRKTAETRVQQALFKHVGVDATELANLSVSRSDQESESVRRKIDELTIKANSASQAMTKKFADWWLQRNHTFHYEFNGQYFRVWVTDNINKSKVEFEERSEGFRYFFSFYLLFLVEAEDNHRNCILLLDEPGLHLHGTAQMKLIEFFDKLASAGNQVLYTTHSPFLVDGDHLERARAVYEDPAGTVVSTDVWPKDSDSLFPLQAALGYSICQSLFIAKNQVVVEGPTDYMLLIALNVAVSEDKRLRRDITIIPIGGATNLAPFVSLLSSHGVKFVAIPDNDSAGKQAQASLLKLREMLGSRSGHTTGYQELTGRSEVEELEDIIPEDYYLTAVSKVYPGVNLTFTTTEKTQTPSVVDRCKARIKNSKGEKLDKLAVIQVIVADLHAKSAVVPKELLEGGAKIFSHLNKLF
ncbi:MAG TPA: AAA family ATPase [Verrucomicrobiota bacterium]|nr:AAA family ATPase [Verrucomicrobiota bacterium]